MPILKCKMCGGDLNVAGEERVTECEYCGSKQTLPDVNDEKKVNLFNRANRLRIACEFDKAGTIFEQIIAEFPNEAEAYWGLCLCNYGIEYVDDPATAEKLPTCHRASFEKMRKDENYELALENADISARIVYESQAKEIDRIMGDILSLCKDEKPYDIFICYKETDINGGRTPDSVLAQDIYDELTKKGYRVFFSRITLEDKLGTQYEPYIFSALNSAKVMLVVGTDYEYMNSVWVKNEWSRFLKLKAKDKTKVIIPCYKDMDAYDLPGEFKGLQSQDCGKIGFMQDLTRGIDKLFGKNEKEKTTEKQVERVIVQQGGGDANIDNLLKRVFIFLDDGDFKNAEKYCEKVLDIDPENAQAYLGKLMAELGVRKKEDLKNCNAPFDNSINYQKIMRFGDDTLKNELQGCVKYIEERNENARLTALYNDAVDAMQSATTEQKFLEAKTKFEKIKGFKDADALAEKCGEEAKNCVYEQAKSRMASAKTEEGFLEAKAVFETIKGFKDADALAEKCGEEAKNCVYEQAKSRMASAKSEAGFLKVKAEFERIKGFKDADALEEKCGEEAKNCVYEQAKSMMASSKTEADFLKVKAEFERIKGFKDADALAKECGEKAIKARKRKIVASAVCATIAVAIAIAFVWVNAIQPMLDYNNAVALMEQGEYGEAISAFKALNGYKDSKEKNEECYAEIKYNNAIALMEQGKYGEAISVFEELNEYKDSKEKIEECNAEIKYNNAIALMEQEEYREAIAIFDSIDGHKKDEVATKSAEIRKILAPKETVFASLHTVGLKSDGTVVAVGNNKYGQCDVSSWKDIIAVSAGDHHTVGLKSDGTVVAVGWNDYGQCDVSNWKNIIAVSAGYAHTVGLKSNGTVVAVGWNDYGQCYVWSCKDIIAVSAGEWHTVGLKSDGTVVAVGYNKYGQCDVSSWENVIAVCAGVYHTVGLKSDGTVVAVGNNEYDRCDVSNWKDIIAVSAGYRHTVGLKSDGTVAAVGSDGYGRYDISNWKDIIAVSAGDYHTVGLKSDGTVVAVGDNNEVSNWKDIRLPGKVG